MSQIFKSPTRILLLFIDTNHDIIRSDVYYYCQEYTVNGVLRWCSTIHRHHRSLTFFMISSLGRIRVAFDGGRMKRWFRLGLLLPPFDLRSPEVIYQPPYRPFAIATPLPRWKIEIEDRIGSGFEPAHIHFPNRNRDLSSGASKFRFQITVHTKTYFR